VTQLLHAEQKRDDFEGDKKGSQRPRPPAHSNNFSVSAAHKRVNVAESKAVLSQKVRAPERLFPQNAHNLTRAMESDGGERE
jgi:hypothetical protein